MTPRVGKRLLSWQHIAPPAVAIMVLLLPLTAAMAADDQPQSPLSFDSTDAIDLTGEAPKALLTNATGVDLEVTLQVSIEGVPKDLVTTTPLDGPILAGTTTAIRISVSDTNALDKKSYKGSLAAIVSPSDAVGAAGFAAQQPLILDLSATLPKAGLPGVEKWSVIFYRDILRNRALPGRDLPLTNPPPAGATAPVPLGVLAMDSGESARITGHYTEGQSRLRLKVQGGRRPGTYTGKIDLTPEDDKTGVVDLTLRRTDGPLKPILTLTFGLICGLGVRRLGGVIYKARQLDDEIVSLSASVSEKQDDFRNEAAFRPWGIYDLGPASEKVAKEARAKVVGLRHRISLSIDEKGDDFATAKKSIKLLRDAVDSWGSEQATKLEALHAAMEGVETDSSGSPPGSPRTYPAFVDAARKDLTGKTFDKIDEPVKLFERVDAAKKLADSWSDFTDLLETFKGWAVRIADTDNASTPISSAEQRKLDRAVRLISQAEWNLWEAKDAADLKDRGSAEQLHKAEQLLAGLNYRLAVEDGSAAIDVSQPFESIGYYSILGPSLALPRSPAILQWLFPRLPFPSWPSSLGSGVPSGGTTAQRVSRTRVPRALWAFILVLVAGAGAIYTAYIALVAGKAFGLFTDYLAAFMWGLASGAVLDALSTTINQVTSPALGPDDVKEASPKAAVA